MPRKFFDRLSRIDQLISMKCTGTPSELANRLDISESTLYEFLGLMKDLGAPIEYDKTRGSYVYAIEGKMRIRFLPSSMISPKLASLNTVKNPS